MKIVEGIAAYLHCSCSCRLSARAFAGVHMRGELAYRSAHVMYACHPSWQPPLPVQVSAWPLPPGNQQAYWVGMLHTQGELYLPLPYLPNLRSLSLGTPLLSLRRNDTMQVCRRQIPPDAAVCNEQWQRRTASPPTAFALSSIFTRKLLIARVSAWVGAALLASPVSRVSSAAFSALSPQMA